jgi:hypothetical protein
MGKPSQARSGNRRALLFPNPNSQHNRLRRRTTQSSFLS